MAPGPHLQQMQGVQHQHPANVRRAPSAGYAAPPTAMGVPASAAATRSRSAQRHSVQAGMMSAAPEARRFPGASGPSIETNGAGQEVAAALADASAGSISGLSAVPVAAVEECVLRLLVLQRE